MTTADFSVRTATPADAGLIAYHRAEMFRDIHSLSDALCVALEHASRAPTAHLLRAGEYLGWLASPADDHNTLVDIVLHASTEGRPLYESLGFVATNEMRYAGPPPLDPSP